MYCKFSQLGDSQTTLFTPFSCFIALWKHTCRPIKMHIHVLSKLFYNYSLILSLKWRKDLKFWSKTLLVTTISWVCPRLFLNLFLTKSEWNYFQYQSFNNINDQNITFEERIGNHLCNSNSTPWPLKDKNSTVMKIVFYIKVSSGKKSMHMTLSKVKKYW